MTEKETTTSKLTELTKYFDKVSEDNTKEVQPDKTKKYRQVKGVDTLEARIRTVVVGIDQLMKIACDELGIPTDDSIKYYTDHLYTYENTRIDDTDYDIYVYVGGIEGSDIRYEGNWGDDYYGASGYPAPDEYDVGVREGVRNDIGSAIDSAGYPLVVGNFDIEEAVRRTLSPVTVNTKKRGPVVCHPWLTSDYKKTDPYAGSQGVCAGAVRQYLEAGGLDMSGRPMLAKDYHLTGYLKSIGFTHINTLRSYGNGDTWTTSNARLGDIAVMTSTECGHICMYCGHGTQWVSDFTQQHMNPYKYPMKCYIYRFGA